MRAARLFWLPQGSRPVFACFSCCSQDAIVKSGETRQGLSRQGIKKSVAFLFPFPIPRCLGLRAHLRRPEPIGRLSLVYAEHVGIWARCFAVLKVHS